jgi:penicillin-binding protein 2
VDLEGERSGINPSREWKRSARSEPWYHGETIITSIGQGYNLSTPLQLAHATMVLANRGKGYGLHLLKSVESPDGEFRKELPVQALPDGFHGMQPSQEQWEYIIQGMEKVVHDVKGTAHKVASGISYKMAGKTGTSQVYSVRQDEEALKNDELPYELRDHALFIAFAPIEAPQIVVVVVVEHGGGGSSTAAPLARQVMDAYFEMQR